MQAMALRLIGAKALTQSMLPYSSGTNFGEIKPPHFSLNKMHLKAATAEWQPFYIEAEWRICASMI